MALKNIENVENEGLVERAVLGDLSTTALFQSYLKLLAKIFLN